MNAKLLSHKLILNFVKKWQLKKDINSSDIVKLHLGCGDEYLPGYINVDSYTNAKVDLYLDARNLNLFPDNSITSIESYHLFEHFELQDAKKALQEWFRVLKPGGLLIIELPNLNVCIREIGKHFDKNNIDLAMVGIYSYPPLIAREGIGQIHKWGWTPETLSAELLSVGFVEVQEHPIKQTYRLAASFNRDMQIRAIKPN